MFPYLFVQLRTVCVWISFAFSAGVIDLFTTFPWQLERSSGKKEAIATYLSVFLLSHSQSDLHWSPNCSHVLLVLKHHPILLYWWVTAKLMQSQPGRAWSRGDRGRACSKSSAVNLLPAWLVDIQQMGIWRKTSIHRKQLSSELLLLWFGYSIFMLQCFGNNHKI